MFIDFREGLLHHLKPMPLQFGVVLSGVSDHRSMLLINAPQSSEVLTRVSPPLYEHSTIEPSRTYPLVSAKSAQSWVIRLVHEERTIHTAWSGRNL